jgi:hypothetical protein
MRECFGDNFVGGEHFRGLRPDQQNPPFFHYTGDTRWELIRKARLLETLNRDRHAQEEWLRTCGEYVLDAQTLVYAMMVKFYTDRVRMFQGCIVRTRDLYDNYGASLGRGGSEECAFPHKECVYHVAVGHFGEHGFTIMNDAEGPKLIGVASAVKY